MTESSRLGKARRLTSGRLLAPLAFTIILAACDEGPATNTRFMHPSGSQEFLIAATRNQGALYLEVSGQAFAAASDLEADLAATIGTAIQSRVLTVTTDAATAENPNDRLLLLFNAPAATAILTICEDPAAGGPAQSDGRVEVLAAFCNGKRLISAVNGWAGNAEGPDSPRFRQLIRQTARDLFKPRAKTQ